MTENYLDALNPQQRAAVECTEGPVMIIAGAGSGKTRVLTYRIVHLLKKDVDPFNILSLTFTNKAAKEMRERIQMHVGAESKSLWMGTFHSVFSRILRIHAEKLGYSQNFTIYDSQDSRNLIKTIVKEKNLNDKIYKPHNIQYKISQAKNKLIGAEEYCNNETLRASDQESQMPLVGEIYKEYTRRCFLSSAMDFDDLLFKMYLLLKKHPEMALMYSQKFKYIMIDEYQDTNYAQYMIVKLLGMAYENICIVGDDAQSIYNFRGADISNILNFKKHYPDCKEFKLEENYRSTKTIVNCSNGVIKGNKKQIQKTIFTNLSEGKPITVFSAPTDAEEASIISKKIKKITENISLSLSEVSIFYRTNQQSRALEESLRRNKISYKVYGGLSFYDRKEVKDGMAYLKFITNPYDEEMFKRIINFPHRGIGNVTLNKIFVHCYNEKIKVWDFLQTGEAHKIVSRNAQSSIAQFRDMMQKYNARLESEDAYEIAKEVFKESGLLEFYGGIGKSPEDMSRYENIKELLNGIRNFVERGETEEERKLATFVQEVSLLTEADRDAEEKEHVSLMTIHASKGLEFDTVFVSGMEEDLFPSPLSVNSRDELEEERRLFYVAITRAKNNLYLSHSQSRFKWGQLQFGEPSRFLDEINDKYIHFEKYSAPQRTSINGHSPFNKGRKSSFFSQNTKFSNKENSSQSPPKPASPNNMKAVKKINPSQGNFRLEEDLKENMTVLHETFGRGKVLSIQGIKGSKKAEINFETKGKKTVFIKFSKLTILS